MIYRVDMILRKEGDSREIRKTSTRIYSDQLEVSEYNLHMKGMELIRDMQYADNTHVSLSNLYPRTAKW